MDDLQFYREQAARGKRFRGLTVMPHQEVIGRLIQEHGARTLLDFGCGAGDQYRPPFEIHKRWGIEKPTLYDPAFPTHDKLPEGQFDGVIVSDVLEHLNERDVPSFIERIFGYAKSFVWASVCCRPAHKNFPDGRNIHLTVQPLVWWERQFQAQGKSYVLEEGL